MDSLLPQPRLWYRIWKSAVNLSPLEEFLLLEFVQRMPVNFQPILRSQLASYNLVQRDPDWLELRFYRFVRGRVDRSPLPLLSIKSFRSQRKFLMSTILCTQASGLSIGDFSW